MILVWVSIHLWQSHVEIEGYSIASRISTTSLRSKRRIAELPLRVGLIRAPRCMNI